MKKTFISFIATAMLAACSPIDSDEYLVHVEAAPIGRAVLIEDFTGQRCVNCPEATEVIHSLINDYGEKNIIAVAIHSNPNGFAGNAKNVGLMNDESKAYGEYWQVETQPCGLVNRSGKLTDREEWATLVRNEIQKTAPISLELSASSSDGKTVEISADMTAVANIDAKLQLWIVEDSIVAMQSMPDGTNNREYIHNHVFRGAVNGQWGEAFTMQDGGNKIMQYSYSLSEGWKPENCSVVGFVYDDKNGVLQAAKTPLYN